MHGRGSRQCGLSIYVQAVELMHELFDVFRVQGDELAANIGCVWVEAQSFGKELYSCFRVCDFRKPGCYHFDSDILVVGNSL